jgi:NO-binding membrane sensor protein with MHYT domain
MAYERPVYSQQVKKTWKPDIAGILNIIGGFACGVLGYAALNYKFSTSHSILDAALFPHNENVIVAIVLFVSALLAITGGILCVGRKMWGVAIAGSILVFLGLGYVIMHYLGYLGLNFIFAFFTGFQIGDPSWFISPILVILLLAVLAIAPFLFTILGKDEFK